MAKNEEKELFTEYDITTSARDFSLSNIVDLIDSGQIEIPLFQREYVWKDKDASKLIDSLILNLPIPEVFLFMDEQDSKLKVVDGQQRLMSVYFYIKQRFPKDDMARTSMHNLVNYQTTLLQNAIQNEKLFKLFRLTFDEDYQSKYEKKLFSELPEDLQMKLKLRRSIRAQVLRQNKPDDGGSAMFEVFNRLNTTSRPLNAQEVRASLFYCDFYVMMQKLNGNSLWRQLQGKESTALRGKDIEHILTAFAFLENVDMYNGKKKQFLNKYSQASKKFDAPKIKKLETLFVDFLNAYVEVYKQNLPQNKFSILEFETIFTILCEDAYKNNGDIIVDINKIKALLSDTTFKSCVSKDTSTVANVERKLDIARKILL
ncbi:MAG: DUF262 domain-containing protein [Firmicutes bacterium]|nr:DUF262 domain-containing protein [Bacillota bacterium]